MKLINANGPAVGLSRRYPTQHPGRILVPRRRRSHETVTVQGGYGALFAVMLQILLSITRVEVQVLSEPQTYHRLQILLGVLAQCRGTKLIEARRLSRYTEF